MDKPTALEWSAALRSGNYPQTRGAMKNFQGFCCLGVLAKIHHIQTSPASETYSKLEKFLTTEEQSEFIQYNDQNKFTFNEIADKIDERYLKEK